MAAKRGKRKPPRKARKSTGGSGIWPWAAVAVVLGIVGYDHWSSIKPALTEVASKAAGQPVPKVASAQTAVPAPQTKPVIRSADSLPVPPAPIPVSVAASAAAASPVPSPSQPLAGSFSEAFGMCGQGAHFNCVFDGGTFWVRGAKIRIADIDAPTAIAPHCEEELRRANAAKVRLLYLLNAGPFVVQPLSTGGDVDGAKLRRVVRNGQSLGDMLVNEGLAHRIADRALPWCA